MALSFVGLLLACAVGTASPATRGTGQLAIGFDDIEPIVRAQSPHVQILGHEMAAVAADRRGSLNWSNPALAYDHEEYDAFREWQLTLHKRISMPFSRGHLTDAWDDRIEAEELKGDQSVRDLLADLKGEYVKLRLLEAHLHGLDQFAHLVDLAADVSSRRHTEGELSGLNRRLIQLALYTVETAEHRFRNELRHRLAAWRADMGIPASSEISLTTQVNYQAVDLEAISAYQGRLEEAPGYRSRAVMVQALGHQVEAARPGLFPGFDIYGGYKSFDPHFGGFVAGIAFDLPVFDLGAGEAGRLEAERRIIESELAADRTRRQEEVAALVTSLREAQPLLAGFSEYHDQANLAQALLLSYQEGAINLDELLGSIQVGAAALDDHHRALAEYYLNIFRLEALTGAKLVHFAP